VASRGTTFFSGGGQDHPGSVYISIHCPSVAIAEMLIHEATHQYFYLLSRYGALDQGSAKTYYSPIKRTERPISMILLAHHAFGNVLLFYRLCRQKGLRDAGYCERHEASLAPQVQQLQDTLAGAKALTALGDALWQPLASRLN
jgi:HEXXH motif-containing protein